MIKVHVKKKVERGVRKYRILSLECLTEKECPAEYVANGGPGYEYCYLTPGVGICAAGDSSITDHQWIMLRIGALYTESELETRINYLRKCGERLHTINNRLKEENANWKGEEIFCI